MSSFFGGGGGSVNPTTMFSPWGFLASDTLVNIAPTVLNKVTMCGFYLPNAVTFSNIAVVVTTGDGAHNYDWGIYNSSGILVANVGSHTAAATGTIKLPNTQGAVTLQPGKYYFAVTGNAILLNLGLGEGSNVGPFTFLPLTNSATNGGTVLPSSVTPPADALAGGSSILAYTFLLL